MQDAIKQIQFYKKGYTLPKQGNKQEAKKSQKESENSDKNGNSHNKSGATSKGDAKKRPEKEKKKEKKKGKLASGRGICYLIERDNEKLKRTIPAVLKDIALLQKDAEELLKSLVVKSITTAFDIEDVPEEYRHDVEEYFKALSEEQRKKGKTDK